MYDPIRAFRTLKLQPENLENLMGRESQSPAQVIRARPWGQLPAIHIGEGPAEGPTVWPRFNALLEKICDVLRDG